MKLRVVVEVNLDDASYELEMSDNAGKLSDKDVPLACAVTARVLEHVLEGRAQRVASSVPTALTLKVAGKPKRDLAN